MSTKNDSSVWSMVKLGLILAAFAVVSCTLLAVVNNLTAPVIARNEKEAAFKAMSEVCDQADSFEAIENFDTSSYTAGTSVKIKAISRAMKDGVQIGTVVQVKGPTYDTAEAMIGFDMNHIVTGVRILSITDSPGFGQKAADKNYKVKSGETFYGQFTGKDAKDGFKVNENFDAISGATITSNGIGSMLTVAAQAAMGAKQSL